MANKPSAYLHLPEYITVYIAHFIFHGMITIYSKSCHLFSIYLSMYLHKITSIFIFLLSYTSVKAIIALVETYNTYHYETMQIYGFTD